VILHKPKRRGLRFLGKKEKSGEQSWQVPRGEMASKVAKRVMAQQRDAS